jgi:peptidoglycan/LPS O-acetylase OafA/YrhL
MPLGDNGPLWSLSCEWFYYMSFPLALWLLRCRPRVPALAAMTGLLAIVAWEFPVAAQYYPIWLFGIVARFAGERLSMGRSSLFAFALALAASLTIEYLNVVPQATGDIAVGLAAAGMLSCRAVRCVRLGRLHGRLAGFSYSLYVVHFPIATALIGAWQQSAHVQHRSTAGPVAFLVFSATLLGCYLAAFAIAQFTERRTGDFRRALSGILVSLHFSEPSGLVADSRSSAVVERIKLKLKFSPSAFATIVCLVRRFSDLSRTIAKGISEAVSPESANDALPPAKVLSRPPSHHRPHGAEPV